MQSMAPSSSVPFAPSRYGRPISSAQRNIAAGGDGTDQRLRQPPHRHLSANRIDHGVELQRHSDFIPAAGGHLADITAKQVRRIHVVRIKNHDMDRSNPEVIHRVDDPGAADLIVGEHQAGFDVIARAVDGDA